MLYHMEYTYSEEAADAETYSSITPQSSSLSSIMRKKKKKNMNTRRFSDEQIKSLESMFETESRLEPRKKLQLARELGLQPRQVAIWFQNKRARWKSKQLERDYTILTNSYNNLNSNFEALMREKQALLIQLQKLNDLIQKPLDQAQSSTQEKAANSNTMDSESENGDTTKSEPDLKPSTSSILQRSTTERDHHNHHHHVVLGALSDDDTSIKVEYFNNMEDEPGLLLNFAEHGGDGSLTSPEDWSTFDSDDILGQSTSDYQWWDFWS